MCKHDGLWYLSGVATHTPAVDRMLNPKRLYSAVHSIHGWLAEEGAREQRSAVSRNLDKLVVSRLDKKLLMQIEENLLRRS